MARKRKSNGQSSENTFNTKRQRPLEDYEEDREPHNFSSARPTIDPNSGQRGAFPGLDEGTDADLFYGPASDGMEYLRMVRSEAKGVPNLLVAPKETGTEEDDQIYNSGNGDSRGYYRDGAYIAAPMLDASTKDALPIRHDDLEPQDAYYDALRLRFQSLRTRLQRPPPAFAIAALDDNHPISLPPNSKAAFAQWRYLLQTKEPLPAQLAAMDQETILRLIRVIITGLKRGREISKTTSRWIWGLLARLREVGCLGSEEVGIVRDLGKRAVWVAIWLRQAQAAQNPQEIGDDPIEEDELSHDDDSELATNNEERRIGEEETNAGILEPDPGATVGMVNADPTRAVVFNNSEVLFEDASNIERVDTDEMNSVKNRAEYDLEDGEVKGDGELAAAKRRLMSQIAEGSREPAGPSEIEKMDMSSSSSNTTITLDMIITIAGELYGQRDLLEFRDLWDDTN
ncbi:MAG: hypothetical protein M1827_007283 [Pycnora praestabilis]|nr:MAG: hypothetical protein M1827_007283 [Pycnora praestabilis]